MEKPREQVRIELDEVPQSELGDDQEPKADAKDLEVSELESRITPVQVGTFF